MGSSTYWNFLLLPSILVSLFFVCLCKGKPFSNQADRRLFLRGRLDLLRKSFNPFLIAVIFNKKNQVAQEYERAVIFRLGRILQGGAKGPGIFFV